MVDSTMPAKKKVALPDGVEEYGGVIAKGAPIIIPNADELTPEQLKKAKHAEKMRRYMKRRKGETVVAKRDTETYLTMQKLNDQEMVEISKDTRNLAIQTLNKKLIDLNMDPEQMAKVNLATLATVFGILFDKSQLMNGLATENISIHAKIDVNMSSDKALEELNKMREGYAEGHGK